MSPLPTHVAPPKVDTRNFKESREREAEETVVAIKDLNVFYGDFHAVGDVNIDIPKNRITAFIGPSGCGKSTVLRCINRMNDLVPTARVGGQHQVLRAGDQLAKVDPVEVRRRIGMVFQKPNPFPKSIYDNVAWGARINGFKGNMNEHVERCLRQAALWEEVKDKLKDSGMALSGGQQQRLCIARALANQPGCHPARRAGQRARPDLHPQDRGAAAGPRGRTTRSSSSPTTCSRPPACPTRPCSISLNERRQGILVEAGPTEKIFTNPDDQRTEDYITGRFG